MQLENLEFKDINIFENYQVSWDKIIFDIIDAGIISEYTLCNYVGSNIDNAMFWNTLAYFNYIENAYPFHCDIMRVDDSAYACRVLITREQFQSMINKRPSVRRQKVTYEIIKEELNNRLVNELNRLLPICDYNGIAFTADMENRVYKSIARDLNYETSNITHLSLHDIELYSRRFKSCDNFRCKIFITDDKKDYRKCMHKDAIVFACAKTDDLIKEFLDYVCDTTHTHFDIMYSLNINSNIDKNFQIISIYPNDISEK